MSIKKNDFVEIEFIGKANNEIFDTTNKDEAKKLGLNADVKPLMISVGHQMLLKGFDDDLGGKEIGKEYSLHLTSEQAFGKRKADLIKTVPMRVFREQNMNPFPGMTVQMDNYIAKILSVSGGRVIVDFNNPLAGKEIDYTYKILRTVDDDKERVEALQEFFFRQKFDFEIKDKKVIFKKSEIKPFVDIFKKKFNEITGLEFEVEEKKEEKAKKEEKSTEPKSE